MAKDIPDWLTRGGRPSFMAIGDSLLNGMRSYTMNDALAAASIPALVGASFAPAAGFAPFVRAKYPRPVLLDAEADLHAVLDPLPRVLPAPILLVSLLAHLGDIKAGVAANARAWLDRFAKATAGPATFDNLAIAGAVLGDVFDRTYGDLEKRLTAMEPVIRAGDDPLRWSGGDPVEAGNWGLGEVHVTVNARHLLNPSNQADVAGLRGMTVADVVAARRPRVLLVCLGANHGLVDVVMRGRGEAGMRGLEAFAADWPRCAKRLARVPDLEAVVVLNLPRPSQVPCLMPARADGEGVVEAAPPVPGGYFDAYVSALQPSSSGGAIPAIRSRPSTGGWMA